MNIYHEDEVSVKPSSIHGWGLFSNIDIPCGKKIMLIDGETISEEECINRELEGNVYIFWNGDNYIDTSNTEKIKFINHDCNFNCDVSDYEDSRLILIAYRDIKAGEELAIDYGYEEIYETCRCSLCA